MTSPVKRQSLHKKIFASLRQTVLQSYKPGDQLPPERELAREFGVSIVTLRAATMSLEQVGLVERLSGKGVFVRDPRVSQCVALVSGEFTICPTPLAFKLQNDLLLHVFLGRAGWQVRSYLQSDGGKGNDGLEALRADMRNGHIGLIVWDGELPAEFESLATEFYAKLVTGLDVIAIMDYAGMVRQGVERLVKSGSKRIGLLAPQLRQAIDLRKHFVAELESHGLPVESGWFLDDLPAHDANAGARYVDRIFGTGSARPDGLLILDDYLYRAALPRLIDLGIRIPQDMRIVAHANDNYAYLHPFPVTLFINSVENHVKATATTILEILEGKPLLRRTVPVTLHEDPGVCGRRS